MKKYIIILILFFGPFTMYAQFATFKPIIHNTPRPTYTNPSPTVIIINPSENKDVSNNKNTSSPTEYAFHSDKQESIQYSATSSSSEILNNNVTISLYPESNLINFQSHGSSTYHMNFIKGSYEIISSRNMYDSKMGDVILLLAKNGVYEKRILLGESFISISENRDKANTTIFYF